MKKILFWILALTLMLVGGAQAFKIRSGGGGDMLKSTYDADADGYVDVAAGGTGVSTLADGGLVIGNAGGDIEVVGAGLATQVLVGGGANTAPAWGTDIPTAVTMGAAYVYRTGGTDVVVADGGTGVTSPTDHCVIVGSGAVAMTVLGVGAVKEVLKGVTGADPDFVTERCFSTLDKALADETNTAVTEAQILANKYITNQGSTSEADLVLPALSYHVGIIFIIEEALIMEINPPSGELFDLDGTALDADDVVDSPAVVGSKISLTRMLLADGSTWRWSLDTIRGAWVDGAASD